MDFMKNYVDDLREVYGDNLDFVTYTYVLNYKNGCVSIGIDPEEDDTLSIKVTDKNVKIADVDERLDIFTGGDIR